MNISGSKILLVVGAVCFLCGALVAGGTNILQAPAWEWAFGGFAAWCLAGAV